MLAVTAAEVLCVDAMDVSGFDPNSMEVDDVEVELALQLVPTHSSEGASEGVDSCVAVFAADDWEEL